MRLSFIAAILLFSIVKIRAQESPSADTLIVGGIVFEKVAIETGASEVEWRALLESYLVPVIKKARKKLKTGSYTIDVRFLKERDGSIADTKVLNDPGYGLAEAALKVVIASPRGPRWNPNGDNRNNSRYYGKQLITFQIRK